MLDSLELRGELAERKNNKDPDVRRRAGWCLNAITRAQQLGEDAAGPKNP